MPITKEISRKEKIRVQTQRTQQRLSPKQLVRLADAIFNKESKYSFVNLIAQVFEEAEESEDAIEASLEFEKKIEGVVQKFIKHIAGKYGEIPNLEIDYVVFPFNESFLRIFADAREEIFPVVKRSVMSLYDISNYKNKLDELEKYNKKFSVDVPYVKLLTRGIASEINDYFDTYLELHQGDSRLMFFKFAPHNLSSIEVKETSDEFYGNCPSDDFFAVKGTRVFYCTSKDREAKVVRPLFHPRPVGILMLIKRKNSGRDGISDLFEVLKSEAKKLNIDDISKVKRIFENTINATISPTLGGILKDIMANKDADKPEMFVRYNNRMALLLSKALALARKMFGRADKDLEFRFWLKEEDAGASKRINVFMDIIRSGKKVDSAKIASFEVWSW